MLRNSTALTMGIPRNECNSSKSLSPEILQEASDATANSRNLLSLGSRQTVMVSTGDKRNECERMHSIDSHLSSSFTKYLSSFFLNNTSINSSAVDWEKINLPSKIALSNARLEDVPSMRTALIRLLVSITKDLLIIQNLLKKLFCQSPFLHFRTNFIQVLNKIFFRLSKFTSHCEIYPLRNPVSPFLRRKSPFFGYRFIYLNNYSFHSTIFILKILHNITLKTVLCSRFIPNL